MFNLFSLFFTVVFIFYPSLSAQSPESWGVNTLEPECIHVFDGNGIVVDRQKLADLPKNISYQLVVGFKESKVEARSENGALLDSKRLLDNAHDYRLICIDHEYHLLPKYSEKVDSLDLSGIDPEESSDEESIEDQIWEDALSDNDGKSKKRKRENQGEKKRSLRKLNNTHSFKQAVDLSEKSDSSQEDMDTEDAALITRSNNVGLNNTRAHNPVPRAGAIQYHHVPAKLIKSRSKYAGLNLSEVAYWRISPVLANHFELLDRRGTVLHIEHISVKGGRRRGLSAGYLNVKCDGSARKIRRDPNDHACLWTHYFVSNIKDIKLYDPKYQKPNRADVNFNAVVSWRIDPNNPSLLLLLDMEEMVLHTETVRTIQGARPLYDGYLKFVRSIGKADEKHYHFRRHPQDDLGLENCGFAEGSNGRAEIYGEAFMRTPRNLDDFQAAVCWRVSPDNPGSFELLDRRGTVVHTEPITTHRGARYLRLGYLALVCAERRYHFRRDFNDDRGLTQNGFAAGQEAKVCSNSVIQERKDNR